MINVLRVCQAATRCAGVENHRNNNANQAIGHAAHWAKASTSIICNSWCSSINLVSCSTHLYWWRFSSERLLTSPLGSLVRYWLNLNVLSIAPLEDIDFVIQIALMPTLTQAGHSAVCFSIHFTLIKCSTVSLHSPKFEQNAQWPYNLIPLVKYVSILCSSKITDFQIIGVDL